MVINSRNCNFISTDKPVLGHLRNEKEVMGMRWAGKRKVFYGWWLTLLYEKSPAEFKREKGGKANEILFERYFSHLCVSEDSSVERRCTVHLANQKPAEPWFLWSLYVSGSRQYNRRKEWRLQRARISDCLRTHGY